MRVLLVDDHPLFLEGLRNFLTANDVDVVGVATDMKTAFALLRTLRPDLVLMDVEMPECDGIEATRRVKAEFPDCRIVMLTVSQDDRHLFDAIKAGAAGYLLKGMPKQEFLELLAGIEQGQSPLSPGLAAKVLQEFARLQRERDESAAAIGKPNKAALLTERQLEILQLVAQGSPYKEIGERLYLSEATIKYHMGEITHRLQLENRSQVIAFAAEIGLCGDGAELKKR